MVQTDLGAGVESGRHSMRPGAAMSMKLEIKAGIVSGTKHVPSWRHPGPKPPESYERGRSPQRQAVELLAGGPPEAERPCVSDVSERASHTADVETFGVAPCSQKPAG